eukprot:scaffold721_cov131-Cylindrotheca_fusiformis.AAC.73
MLVGRRQDLSVSYHHTRKLFSKDVNSGIEHGLFEPIIEDPKRSIYFSFQMTACGASLGPFLDAYHSAFGVLRYDNPLTVTLWGTEDYPALTTAWWVPELFGLAGFIIGWLYIVLDDALKIQQERKEPSPSKVLIGISIFTLQYWLSGFLYNAQVDRSTILNIMSVVAAGGFALFDRTLSGLIASTATGLGGPLIEVGLLWLAAHGHLADGYRYNDLGETGVFPLWIIPVYFLGGPANGNLARCFWNALTNAKKSEEKPCQVCNGTRRNICPNCDGMGTYVAMGERSIKCSSCKGRGYVICRACFDSYDEDPFDIDAIHYTTFFSRSNLSYASATTRAGHWQHYGANRCPGHVVATEPFRCALCIIPSPLVLQSTRRSLSIRLLRQRSSTRDINTHVCGQWMCTLSSQTMAASLTAGGAETGAIKLNIKAVSQGKGL